MAPLVASLSCMFVSPAQAGPTDSATAQALFDQAKKLLAEGKYAEACPKLEESQRLDPGSGTLLNLGSCYERAGRVASAWSKYLEAAAAARTAGQSEREKLARNRAAALAPRVSNILIKVTAAEATPGLEVKRDDAPIGTAQWGTPIPADPGPHKISASAPGRKAWDTVVTVDSSGKTITVSISELAACENGAAVGPTPAASAAAAAAPDPGVADRASDDRSGFGAQRTAAVATGLIGVAGLTVGTLFGLKSKSKHDEAAQVCTPGCASADGLQAKADAQHAGNVSTIAFIVGIAGVASAATLWFTAPTGKSDTPTLRVGAGLGGVSIRGGW